MASIQVSIHLVDWRVSDGVVNPVQPKSESLAFVLFREQE